VDRFDDFSGADLVGGLMRDLRVQSTILCRSELSAPWGFAVRPRDLAAFHVVLRGECFLEIEGVDGGVRLEAGDLVILPYGQGHVVRDDEASAVTALDDLLSAGQFDGYELRHGGGGHVTELLCGGFAVDGREESGLLAALPPFLVVRGEGGRSIAWLADLLGLMKRELEASRPGGREIVDRLADLLLAQALRTFLTASEAELPPLRALEDRHVATAVWLVHERPEHAWTVTELASKAAMSRSAFAGRFRELIGEPPMHYVRRRRLARAAEYLRANDRSIAEIARLSGYESAVSLTKAFEREFGVPPGRYRELQRSVSGSGVIEASAIRQAASSPERRDRIT
jgi:AraC family transcriptional regulator, alkane utilization regulator